MSQVKAVQYRKWSPLANDPQTANDPQQGPQMIPTTASDPVKSGGMEWISGMDGECAENLNNA